ncbi:MAG: hypothetical protein ACWGPN_04310 [Gammaproteobacteria bacterium]
MPDMSRWEADAPGLTSAWWAAHRSCVPPALHGRFDEFTNLLNIYNLAPNPANLAPVSACVGHLLDELGSRVEPKYKSQVMQTAYKLATMPKTQKPAQGQTRLQSLKNQFNAQKVPTHMPGGMLQSKAPVRERIGTALNMPGIKTSSAKKTPTENLEIGLRNLMEALGAAPVPPQYDV